MLRDAGTARLLLRRRSRRRRRARDRGAGSGTYHFSSGNDVSIKELYDAVCGAMKLNYYPEPEMRPLGPDDAPSILLDPSRTFADFGDITFTALWRHCPGSSRTLGDSRRAWRLYTL